MNNDFILPRIYPISKEVNRPFWSVMIPTYNCANYLVETLKSVLAQDPGAENMQIEVVDDCSTKDDPDAVVKEIGKGRVCFFRQPQNVGVPANFNTCIQRAKGQWIHIFHGDDTVLPGFYDRLRAGIEKKPATGAAFCRYLHMNELGHWQVLSPVERETPGILSDFLASLAVVNRIMTPSIVVKRSVYEKLGGFNLELFHSADWDMWKRIAAYYPVWYEPQTLACYRVHSASDASKLTRYGANITEAYRAIEIAQSYLPSQFAAEISSQAREHQAFKAINIAYRMLAKSDLSAAIAQIRAGLKCSQSPRVIGALVNFLQQIATNTTEFNFLPFTALDQFLAEFQSLASLSQDVEHYQQEPTDKSARENLRDSRKQVAEKWLQQPTEQLGQMYLGDVGKAHKILVESGIQSEPLTDSEQNLVDEILENLSQGFAAQPQVMNYLLAMMLYLPIEKLPLPSNESQIPNWFHHDYVELARQQRLSIESLKLKNINFIVFPDWSQPEEYLSAELAFLLREIATHPDKSQITLLIDTNNISEEDAEMVLSGVTMHLLMEEGLEIDEETTISLVEKLTEIQWQALLPRLNARIVLASDHRGIAAANTSSYTQFEAEKIPTYQIDNFQNKRVLQLETGAWSIQ